MKFLKLLSKFNYNNLIKINLDSLRNCIIFEGPLGKLEKIFNLDNLRLIDNKNILINKIYLKTFLSEIDKLFIGITYGWYFILYIFGRGFNFRVIKYNKLNYLRIKIGYSHFIYYLLPHNLYLKINKKKNKLIFFGLNYIEVSKLVYELRFIRSSHTYKIQGIKFMEEECQIKSGKQRQV